MTKFNISLSHVFHDKEPINGLSKQQAFGTPTPATLVTPQELFEHITSGKAFVVGTYEGDRKHKDNFIQSQTLWLDLDNDVSIAKCLTHPFVKQYAFMLYPSASSSFDCYKTRVGFLLDESITDSEHYERYVSAVMEECSALGYDNACKDSARLFFGSTNTTEQAILRNENE